MSTDLSPEEFEQRLKDNLAQQAVVLEHHEAENQELRQLLEEKKNLVQRLRTFLQEVERESARLDTAIARVTATR